MLPIVSAQKSQSAQSVNGAAGATHKPARTRGRDLVDAAIRLRVYIAKELRRQCEEENLDVDQYGSNAVTALCISLERKGVAGMPSTTAE